MEETVLPSWVVGELKDFVLGKKSGDFIINFNKGGVRNVRKTDVVHPPEKKTVK